MGEPDGPARARLTPRQRLVLAGVDRMHRIGSRGRRLLLRPQLPGLPRDIVIGRRPRIYGGIAVTFGSGVRIGDDVRLQVIFQSAGESFSPSISIGDRTSFEDRVHVGAIGRVEIGDDVLVASNVLILDHSHDYTDPDVPVGRQPLLGGGLVIGDGSHIGENVSILGPVRVGRHSVVGAHSVVVSDVPDLSVVVGAPARVIRRYDAAAGEWQSVQ